MKYTVELLKEIAEKNSNVAVVYFWGHTPNPKKITVACLSQWYDCWFEVEGVLYHTTEQYMMASKARLFGDDEVLQEIMEAPTPFEYKSQGRKIRGFDAEAWDAKKYDIVVEDNKAKFSQNPALKEFLLSTGDSLLAEASPYDTIWGIGLGREDALKGGVDQWQGENLLGCALMDVRDWLRETSAE